MGDESLARRLVRIGRYLEDPERDGARIALFVEMVQRTLEAWLQEETKEEKERPSLIIKPPR